MWNMHIDVEYKGTKGALVWAEIGDEDGFLVYHGDMPLSMELHGCPGDALDKFIEYADRRARG